MNNDNTFNGKINLKDYEKFAIKSFRDIRAVPNSENAHILGIPFCGKGFEAQGILGGDLLITRLESDLSKVSASSLCIVHTYEGKRIAIYAKDISDEKLFGVVVRIERDLEVAR
jgi:hypothetical protein